MDLDTMHGGHEATNGECRSRRRPLVLLLAAIAMVAMLLPATAASATETTSGLAALAAPAAPADSGRDTAVPYEGAPPAPDLPTAGAAPTGGDGAFAPAVDIWDPGPGIGGDYVYFEGAAGDAISQGLNWLYTPVFADLDLSESGRQIDVSATFDDESWNVRMVAPTSQAQWTTGFYPNVEEAPGGDATKGLLLWSGEGNTCADVTGWVSVDELVRSAGAITRLVVRFEQSCNGGPVAHGKIVLGSPAPNLPPGSPFGNLDLVSIGPGGVTFDGWTIDPDTASPIPVIFYIDDDAYAAWADQTRLDVATTYPLYTGAHGFSVLAPASPGRHDVCVLAANVGAGSNTLMGCRSITVPGPSPFGSLDVAKAVPNGVQVGGWAIDPDSDESIAVHVYVDGKGTAITANGNRPDLDNLYPAYGPAHGYGTTVPAGPGQHQVCVYGINLDAGGNTLLGCRTVNVPGGSPIGSLDMARQGPSSVVVGGWALDFDTTGSIPVHVYVDGKGTALTADGERADVGAVFAGWGTKHGFSATISTTPGRHQVCAYGINTGVGANVLLGCRTVDVPSGSPIGTIDVARGGPGWVSVGGWALDADTGDPIQVHVYVDTKGTAITANGARPDVGAYFFGWGDAHGYATTISATPGVHNVCVYGINVGPGGNTLLGCRTVTVT